VAAELFFAEPRSAYATRAPIVVDSSLIAAIVFAEPEFDLARARLSGFTPIAPALLDFDIANAMTTRLRRRAISVDEAAQATRDFLDLPVERAEIDAGALPLLADRFGLTAYDAAYLWLAGEIRAPLATFDARLARAAAKYLGELPLQP
jgi:predicted nucleic acid-binding protein